MAGGLVLCIRRGSVFLEGCFSRVPSSMPASLQRSETCSGQELLSKLLSALFMTCCAGLRCSACQVCQLVSQSDSPEDACDSLLDKALEVWEDRLAADNISTVVIKFLWNDDGIGTL